MHYRLNGADYPTFVGVVQASNFEINTVKVGINSVSLAAGPIVIVRMETLAATVTSYQTSYLQSPQASNA